MAALRTEFPFVLPKGMVDADGTLHREGAMRLATARDELEPLSDPKVRDADDPYLAVVVLSRVITRLGSLTRLTPKDVEGMFAADLAHLQDVYSAINYGTAAEIERLTGLQDPSGGTAPLTAAVDGATAPTPTIPEPTPAAAPTPAPETTPPTDEPSTAPRTRGGRRARIEEVGRSSGRPGSARS